VSLVLKQVASDIRHNTIQRRKNWVSAFFFIFCALLCFAPTASDADRLEGIRHTEDIGASQLALRAVTLGGNSSKNANEIIVELLIPSQVEPTTVELDVRDRVDKGYFMHATSICEASGACEYRWPTEKARSVGIGADMLWSVARTGRPEVDGALIPVCFCQKEQLRQRSSVKFVFIPSQTVNLTYQIYSDIGQLIEKGRSQTYPAGLPITIATNKADDAAKRYKLVVNHIASNGSSVERFSDTFYFYGAPR